MPEKNHGSSKHKKDEVSSSSTLKDVMNTSGSQQSMKGKINPFRKSTKTRKEDFFDINFEDSQDDGAASCTLSQNSVIRDAVDIFKKQKKIGVNKKKIEDAFDIDFEESKEASSQGVLCTPELGSQKLNETCSQDTTVNLTKPELFKNAKLPSNNAFDIDFGDCGQTLTQNSQVSSTSSQKSIDVLSQGENVRPSLFEDRKRRVDKAFEVDYEENSLNDTGRQTQNTQPSQSTESDKENVEDTSISFERPNPFQKAKKQRLSKHFGIDFEESVNIPKVLNTSTTTPTKTAVLPFRKSSRVCREDDFNVNTSENDLGNSADDLTTKTGQVMCNFSTISQRSPTELNRTNATKASTDLDYSSFNDENLRQWMSDQSEDEVEIRHEINEHDESGRKTLPPEVMEPEIDDNEEETRRRTLPPYENEQEPRKHDESGRKTLPPDVTEPELDEETHQRTLPPESEVDRHEEGDRNISPSNDNEPEEDHMQKLQRKLKEIMENARNGKPLQKPPVITRETHTEIPKKPQKKSNPPAKPTLRKPAPFATKRLYNHVITKIRPNYGIDSVVRAEELIIYICDVVKMVVRRKGYQKKLVNDLKMEMAKMGIIETTYQFYEFVREFLPYEFRLKVIPCIQPGTNIVYPPKDAVNPFQKIL